MKRRVLLGGPPPGYGLGTCVGIRDRGGEKDLRVGRIMMSSDLAGLTHNSNSAAGF